MNTRNAPAASSKSWAVSLAFFLGMLLVFAGERLVGAGTLRWISALGVALLFSTLLLRTARMRKASPFTKGVERTLRQLHVLGLLALLLYFVQSDLPALFVDKPLDRTWPKLMGSLAALWPAIWLFSTLPMLMAEIAYHSVARAPRLEIGRIRDATFTGAGLAGALIFAFTLTYVATQRDHKVDLSYFRTAKPGESTRKLVRTLDKEIKVSLFFPPANEVHEEVMGYFSDLQKESPLVQVQNFDYAIEPTKAKELGVSGNGIVVVAREGRKELLSVGLHLEGARSQLRNLDREVQKRILQVARPGRTVYFTSGHGERTFDPASDTDKRPTIRELRDLLNQQGYATKSLGAADGLAADAPADAAIVAIVGAEKPLLNEEVGSIARYLERGGRVLLAVDPDQGAAHAELLTKLALKFDPTPLANDQIYARRNHQASDRANIATATFSSHPSVTTLGRLGARAPMVLFGAGSLEELANHPKDTTLDFTVRAHPATFNDPNGNFTFDEGEKRKAWQLAAAVTQKHSGGKPEEEGRALVVGDSDVMGDGVVGNPGNAYFILDSVKWLVGDEAITGEISSESDVPIAHTKKEDVVWFYSSIFLAPMLVLGVGLLMTRRRKSSVATSLQTGSQKKEAA
jgi:hypothetical protein